MSGLCAETGCPCRATHGVIIHIPAKGYAIEAHTPLQMAAKMSWCERHAKAFSIANWLDPKLDHEPGNLRETVRDMLAALHRAAPDFDRAWVQAYPLESPMMQGFASVWAGKPH